jgi:hypothetical protein
MPKTSKDRRDDERVDVLETERKRAKKKKQSLKQSEPKEFQNPPEPKIMEFATAEEMIAEMNGLAAVVGEPPRMPVVGDKIACFDVNGGQYFSGPYEVISVNWPCVEYRADDMAPPVKERTLVKFTVDKSYTFYAWMSPEGERSVVLHGGYGLGWTQWVFADEERVVYEPALLKQRRATRLARTDFVNPYAPEQRAAPPCDNCGQWPCKKQIGCIDFERFVLAGRRYDPKAQRLETMEEMAERFRIEPADVDETLLAPAR